MSNITEYNDIVAFHPGYYVADIIEDMEISQAEFATRMGTTAKTLSNLVNGQINLSNDLAKKIAVMLGTSPEVWLNLQSAYDQKLIEINCVLNSNSVPREAVKYVIYHEMLHRDNRFHDAAFKREEHKYPKYEEWDHFLEDNMNQFDIKEW